MLTTLKYRIYPTKEQAKTLEENLETCQTLYNQALYWRKRAYEQNGESVSYGTQAASLTQLRKESSFWASFHIDTLQDTLRRLDKAFAAFFRRLKKGEKPGYPRFKSGNRYRSVTYSHLSVNLIRYTGTRLDRVKIPKLGEVKIKLHRPIPDGKIKNLQIVRNASGWYANITVEIPDVPKVEVKTNIGVDVGLNSFLTTSDGDKIDNPRHLRIAEKKLKKLQRRLAKRKKGSHRRSKMRERLARLHEKIVNQRHEFHCKIAHWLYVHKGYDFVAVENLQISNMVKNHHLAKSISDAAWGNFVLRLENKAEKAGFYIAKVNPNGTSQNCSGCGEKVAKSLAVRTHCCDSCGLELDRDENAAINILRVATTRRGEDGLLSSVKREISAYETVFTSPVLLRRGS